MKARQLTAEFILKIEKILKSTPEELVNKCLSQLEAGAQKLEHKFTKLKSSIKLKSEDNILKEILEAPSLDAIKDQVSKYKSNIDNVDKNNQKILQVTINLIEKLNEIQEGLKTKDIHELIEKLSDKDFALSMHEIAQIIDLTEEDLDLLTMYQQLPHLANSPEVGSFLSSLSNEHYCKLQANCEKNPQQVERLLIVQEGMLEHKDTSAYQPETTYKLRADTFQRCFEISRLCFSNFRQTDFNIIPIGQNLSKILFTEELKIQFFEQAFRPLPQAFLLKLAADVTTEEGAVKAPAKNPEFWAKLAIKLGDFSSLLFLLKYEDKLNEDPDFEPLCGQADNLCGLYRMGALDTPSPDRPLIEILFETTHNLNNNNLNIGLLVDYKEAGLIDTLSDFLKLNNYLDVNNYSIRDQILRLRNLGIIDKLEDLQQYNSEQLKLYINEQINIIEKQKAFVKKQLDLAKLPKYLDQKAIDKAKSNDTLDLIDADILEHISKCYNIKNFDFLAELDARRLEGLFKVYKFSYPDCIKDITKLTYLEIEKLECLATNIGFFPMLLQESIIKDLSELTSLPSEIFSIILSNSSSIRTLHKAGLISNLSDLASLPPEPLSALLPNPHIAKSYEAGLISNLSDLTSLPNEILSPILSNLHYIITWKEVGLISSLSELTSLPDEIFATLLSTSNLSGPNFYHITQWQAAGLVHNLSELTSLPNETLSRVFSSTNPFFITQLLHAGVISNVSELTSLPAETFSALLRNSHTVGRWKEAGLLNNLSELTSLPAETFSIVFSNSYAIDRWKEAGLISNLSGLVSLTPEAFSALFSGMNRSYIDKLIQAGLISNLSELTSLPQKIFSTLLFKSDSIVEWQKAGFIRRLLELTSLPNETLSTLLSNSYTIDKWIEVGFISNLSELTSLPNETFSDLLSQSYTINKWKEAGLISNLSELTSLPSETISIILSDLYTIGQWKEAGLINDLLELGSVAPETLSKILSASRNLPQLKEAGLIDKITDLNSLPGEVLSKILSVAHGIAQWKQAGLLNSLTEIPDLPAEILSLAAHYASSISSLHQAGLITKLDDLNKFPANELSLIASRGLSISAWKDLGWITSLDDLKSIPPHLVKSAVVTDRLRSEELINDLKDLYEIPEEIINLLLNLRVIRAIKNSKVIENCSELKCLTKEELTALVYYGEGCLHESFSPTPLQENALAKIKSHKIAVSGSQTKTDIEQVVEYGSPESSDASEAISFETNSQEGTHDQLGGLWLEPGA